MVPNELCRCPEADLSENEADMADGVLTSLIGEIASGDGLNPDDRRGSKKLPGVSEAGLLVVWNRDEELLDVFLRSWCCPVLN